MRASGAHRSSRSNYGAGTTGTSPFVPAPHSVLGTYGRNCDLAFEVDRIDEEAFEGWSVVAVGKAHIIDDLDEINYIRLSVATPAQASPHVLVTVLVTGTTAYACHGPRATSLKLHRSGYTLRRSLLPSWLSPGLE